MVRNMKISKGKLVQVILMLCAFQFFAVFRVGRYIYKTDFINLTTIIFSLIFIISYHFKPILDRRVAGSFYNWIISTFYLWIIEIINSIVKYQKHGQSLLDVLSSSFGMLTIIMVFPLCYAQKREKRPDTLKNILKLMSLIAAVLSIIQVFFNQYGIVFLDTTDSLDRNGRIRFGIAAALVSVGMIISFFDWIEGKKKKDIFAVLIELLFFFYATQTRSRLMYSIAAIYFSLILFLKNRNKRILFFIIGVIAIALLLFSGLASEFKNSLQTDAGILMRSNAISFYISQWLSSPIVGMGYIKASNANSFLLDTLMGPLYYGRIRYYYRNDVGIVGLLNESGILGIVWYIWLIVLLYRSVRQLYKINKKKYTWAVAVYIYVLLCSINLIITSNLSDLSVIIAIMNCSLLYERNNELKLENSG